MFTSGSNCLIRWEWKHTTKNLQVVPLDSVNDKTITIVQTLLFDDRWLTVTNIFNEIVAHYSYVNVNWTSVYHILQNEIDVTKVSAWWFPRLLMGKHHIARIGTAFKLSHYHIDGTEFFEPVVTSDETWMHFWTPESKRASEVWKKKRKKKHRGNAKKFHLWVNCWWQVFRDCWGMILIEYLPQGINLETEKKYTVNQEQYFHTILRLRYMIKFKWSGLLSIKVVLINDKSRPHTAKIIAALITSHKLDTFHIQRILQTSHLLIFGRFQVWRNF